MNPEAKKKLEEMAHLSEFDRDYGNGYDERKDAFMSGAQAAWELATLAERERITALLDRIPNRVARVEDLRERILNPQGSDKE